jgi:prenyltransferase beta subunit
MSRLAFVSSFLMIASTTIQAQTPEQIASTVKYVRSLQTEAGGFMARATDVAGKEPNPPSLRATTGALRALRYFGGEPKDLAACKRFVASCFDKESGGFVDAPGGKPDVVTTAVGLMALVELKVPLDAYRDPAVSYLGKNAKAFEEIRMAAAGVEAAGRKPPEAESWLKQISGTRNADGLFGKDDGQARETGGAVAAMLRLGAKLDNAGLMLRALKAGQRKDGGFGKPGTADSDMETTYRVMRALMMMKDQPKDVAELRAFIGRCRNKDGGYSVTPGQPSTVGGTYYAAIIRHWLGKP